MLQLWLLYWVRHNLRRPMLWNITHIVIRQQNANGMIENEAEGNKGEGNKIKWLEICHQDPLSPFASFHFIFSFLVLPKKATKWHALQNNMYVGKYGWFGFSFAQMRWHDRLTQSPKYEHRTHYTSIRENGAFKGLERGQNSKMLHTKKSRRLNINAINFVIIYNLSLKIPSHCRHPVASALRRQYHVQCEMERSSLMLTQQHHPNDDSILEIS